MANRSYQQPMGSLECNVVQLFGSITIGASGAVSASQGATSVVKNGAAGNYTITLADRFNCLLAVQTGVLSATASGVVPSAEVVATPATNQATFQSAGTVILQFYDYAGVAANPASGAQVTFQITVRNSTVGQYA